MAMGNARRNSGVVGAAGKRSDAQRHHANAINMNDFAQQSIGPNTPTAACCAKVGHAGWPICQHPLHAQTAIHAEYQPQPLLPAQLWNLADQYGTPLWVYDAATIRERIAQLKAFDTVRFAQKACSNIHILKLMREQGVKVDAVSRGESCARWRRLQPGFGDLPTSSSPPT
jgi:hypothetical protein